MTSLLGLKSARFNEIKFSFHEFVDIMADDADGNELDPEELKLFDEFYDDLFDDYFMLETEILETEIPDSGLIYVCGYIAFKRKTKISCNECQKILVSDEDTDNVYFQELNRGGLCVPSNLCIEIGKLTYFIIRKLISEKYENLFVTCSNQKKLIVHFLKESIFLLDVADEEYLMCGTCILRYFEDLFRTF